ARLGGDHLCPPGRRPGLVAPGVRHRQRHQGVVAGAQQRRTLGRLQHRLALQHVDALLVGGDVGGHPAAGLQPADREPGVDRARRVLVDAAPHRVAGAVGGQAAGRRPVPGLRRGEYDVPAGHHDPDASRDALCDRAASSRYSQEASTSRRARSTSASSLPSRLRTTPSTMTVSTLETSAHSVTAATGSFTGTMLMSRASMSTTSAFLPGVSEPVRSSTPATYAPLMVAISSICRAVSMVSGTSLLASQHTALTRARSAPNAARISVNMSPGTVVTTSID